MTKETPLLEIKNLSKYFSVRSGILMKETARVNAVNDVSFSIKKGQTLGLVGESGCGKSTLGKTLLRLIEPTGGQIFFEGDDITHLGLQAMKAMRKQMQIIFQDPYASLNPRMSVGDALQEPLRIHNICKSEKEISSRVDKLLDCVHLPKTSIYKYPHEFSGGQRQRICIARALAVNPKLIVCDESVSALDVSIQAQIVNLLIDLQEELGLTYLFISHDLKIVKFISHNIAVMYLGKLVEMAPVNELYNNPKHPYTKALLSAIPNINPTIKTKRIILHGAIPNPISPPAGCFFSTRCWKATDICKNIYPDTTYYDDRQVSCYHPIDKTNS